MAEFNNPTASRGARQQRVSSQSPLDVPDVNPAVLRDPGVKATPQEFGADAAGAAAEVATAAGETFATLQARRQSYKDTIEAVRLETGFDTDSMKDIETAASQADMTQETVLTSLGGSIAGRRQKLIEEYRATGPSEEALAKFEARLLRREAQFTGNIASQAHELARKRVGSVIDGRINEINAMVAVKPESLPSAFLAVDQELDERGTPFAPVERQLIGTAAKNNLAKTAAEIYIRRGRIDDAKALLAQQEVTSVLGPNTRNAIDTMIDSYESAKSRATQEGVFLRERFRGALGPNATEEQVDAAVQRELKLNTTRVLTPEEVVTVGLPRGTIVQQKPDGTMDLLFKPPEPGATVLTDEQAQASGFPSGYIVQRKKDGNFDIIGKTPDTEAELVGKKKAAELRAVRTEIEGIVDAAGVPPQPGGQRQVVQNPDGSVSTERSITVTDPRINNGQPTNIPSMFGGQQLEQDEAISRIVAAGGKDPETGRALPAFGSIEEAVSAAKARSNQLGQRAPGTQQQPTVTMVGPEGDAERVQQLFRASQRLTLAGQSELANSLLSQARFIAENSPEILKTKKMNEPIPAALASELGVPVGTTMGEIVGVKLRSPEEVAGKKAEATARAKTKVASEEQLSFIGDAKTVISDLMFEIQKDPGIVGVKGSLRATGKTAVGILTDLGLNSLVERARDLAATQTDASVNDVKGWFDSPTLSVLGLIENSVGLMLARLRQPDGRVSVDVIKRSIEDMKLSGLTSSQNVVDRLTFIQKLLDSREKSTRKQSGLPEVGAVSKYRVKDGKLEKVE